MEEIEDLKFESELNKKNTLEEVKEYYEQIYAKRLTSSYTINIGGPIYNKYLVNYLKNKVKWSGKEILFLNTLVNNLEVNLSKDNFKLPAMFVEGIDQFLSRHEGFGCASGDKIFNIFVSLQNVVLYLTELQNELKATKNKLIQLETERAKVQMV